MKEVLPFEKAFDIVIKEELTTDEITQGYNLYQHVKNNNYRCIKFSYTFQYINNPSLSRFIIIYNMITLQLL